MDAVSGTMPLFGDGKPLLSRIWSGEMDLNSIEEALKVSIWVKFIELDLKYWGKSTLFKIASIVGTPVRIDRATEERDYLGYAKLLIEVDVEKKLPGKIGFFNELGGETVVEVEYDWELCKCDVCSIFGHSEDQCRRKKGKENQPPPERVKQFGDARFETYEHVRYTRDQLLQLREVATVPEEILKVRQEIDAELNDKEQNWSRTQPSPSNQPQSRYFEPYNHGWPIRFFSAFCLGSKELLGINVLKLLLMLKHARASFICVPSQCDT